jgi:hypothetical protein
VDPLVGRQLELLGYDPTYSLTPAPAAARAAERARARPIWVADVVRDGATLITRRPLVIDVGAAGKGCLVDIISAILQQAGVAEFVVDAGGDLRHCGEHGIRVGLEHPRDPLLEAVDLHGAHDFRHTFATWLEDAGIPARVIDEVMGHEATSRAGQQRGSAMVPSTGTPPARWPPVSPPQLNSVSRWCWRSLSRRLRPSRTAHHSGCSSGH